MKKAIALMLLSATTNAALADTEVTKIEVPVIKCSEPVKSIAIAQIECAASSCQEANGNDAGFAGLAALFSGMGGVKTVGKGVKSMLTNAIRESGCFKIVDLDQFQKMKTMLEATGQKVEPPKIDLYVNGQITAIDVTKSGGAIGGGFIPLVGLISRNTEEANMAFDLALMNPTTLEIAESKSFNANSSKSSWGFGAIGPGVGGGWSISKSVALDSVVRDVVFGITNYLADTYAGEKIKFRPQPANS